jgi:hypothetical protein
MTRGRVGLNPEVVAGARRKRSKGCAQRFRPTYALANVGHPSCFRLVRYEVQSLALGPALKFDSSGELQPSGGQRRGGLFEEGGLHIPDVGGVVRPIRDVEGVHGKRE